ncbi:MAG: hypothetical protein IKN55_06250 [Oscillospiraceae bacterium]|nr:hypothetical protein [Oscillospiraceae bacterium]
MRIEISYHGGTSSIGQLRADYHSLQKHSDAVEKSMRSLLRFACNMNGGVGSLQDAVSDLDSRAQAESSKQESLRNVGEKLENFLELAQKTDSSVAELVAQNQDEFYRVSGWTRPAVALDDARSWLDKAKAVLDVANKQQINQNSQPDFNEVSDEELQAYYEEMLLIAQNPNRSAEDEARLNEFLAFLAEVDANELKLEDLAAEIPFGLDVIVSRDCLKVRYYTELYEAMPEHEGDKEAMNTFFSNYDDSVPQSDYWRPEEILAMKYLAYKSPQPQHELLMRFMPQIKIADFNAVKSNGDPNCGYNPEDRMIYLNREHFLGYGLGDYHAIYQEIGHNIDDLLLYGIDEPGNQIQMESIDGAYSDRLDQALQNDVSNMVWKKIDEYNDNDAWFGIDGPGKQKIYDVMMGKASYEDLNPRLKWACEKIYYNLRSGLSGSSASDAYESQSGGMLVNGYSHGKEYWQKHPDYDKTEVFSEWFASGVCNSSDDRRSRELLPETYQTMDDMVNNYLQNNPR